MPSNGVVSLPNFGFYNVVFIAWNWPWGEHLHHSNGQVPRESSFSFILRPSLPFLTNSSNIIDLTVTCLLPQRERERETLYFLKERFEDTSLEISRWLLEFFSANIVKDYV